MNKLVAIENAFLESDSEEDNEELGEVNGNVTADKRMKMLTTVN